MSDDKFVPGRSLTLVPAAEQLVSDAIWHLDANRILEARKALVRLLDEFGDPARD